MALFGNTGNKKAQVRKKSNNAQTRPRQQAQRPQQRPSVQQAQRRPQEQRPPQQRTAPLRPQQAEQNNTEKRKNGLLGGFTLIDKNSSDAAALKSKKYFNYNYRRKFDFSFFLVVIILLAFGLVMLFSATYASAKLSSDSNYDSFFYINRQLIFAGLGVAVMIVASFVDYHIFMNKIIIKIATLASVFLIILTRLIGTTMGNAQRWIRIGEITIQPSEILKFVTIMIIAEYMQRNYDKLGDFKKGFFPILLRVGIACALVLFQPHISGTVILFIVSICMFCIGGAKGSHLLLIGMGVLILGIIILVVFPALGFDYVNTRLMSWQDPEADIQGKTYQTYQSLVTIGSGGIFGQGLGNSRQKYSYLPVTENDFIFPVIVEELGFVGAMFVILLFVILIVRGFYIASNAPDKFGMLLCAGIVIQLGVQAFLNIAVTTNAIPNTGVSLPFISYGGTALIMQLGEVGIVLNISRKAALE